MSLTFKTKRMGMNSIMGNRYINPEKLRLDLGLSRRELGLRCQVSGSTIAGWEKRRRTPSVVHAWKLAGALGIVQQNMGKLIAYWVMSED